MIAVWVPSLGRVAFFEQLAMPFGGTPSVHFFIWISRALWVLLLHGLLVICGHWVGDFPVIELEVNAAAAELFVNRFSL